MSLQQNIKTVNGYTASTTQTQAGALPLDAGSAGHRVTTVASAADAVLLPKAVNGRIVIVTNAAAANSMGCFPQPSDKVNALAADAVYALAANKTAMFVCHVDGTWNTILTA
jgi:hypothetical protein